MSMPLATPPMPLTSLAALTVPAAQSSWLDSVLPAQPVHATLFNPRSLIIYSDLKVGKSALCSWLSLNENAFWLDLEDGGEAVSGNRINVIRKAAELKMTRVNFLLKFCEELSKRKPVKFSYLMVDKLDTLEDWSDKWATADYKRGVMGSDFTESSVKLLPKFFGYTLIQEKFKELWGALCGAAPHVIFFGTLKQTRDTGDNNQQGAAQGFVHSTDIDLTGKQRKLTVGDADAIGFLYRGPLDGANYLSFMSQEKGAFCGNRIPRLEGRKFKLSWLTFNCCGQDFGTSRSAYQTHEKVTHGGVWQPGAEKLNVNWKQIFLDEAVAKNGGVEAGK